MAPAQAPAAAEGIGPFTIDTVQGTAIEARLLRRDGDDVWILRRLDASGQMVRTSVRVADIRRIRMPETAIPGILARIQTSDDRPRAVADLLRIEEMLAPYRDLPGVIADEAAFQRARLYESMSDYREAVQVYAALARQRERPELAAAATIRAGLCAGRLGQHSRALALLDLSRIDDQDVDLLSDALFARARALAAEDRHEEAVLTWLRIVVFHPTVRRGEPRSLEAVIPSYAALGEWPALALSLNALRQDYPDAEETARALATVAQAPWRDTLVAHTGIDLPEPPES